MFKRFRKSVLLCVLLLVIGIASITYLLVTRSYRALDTVATKISLPEGATWYDWMTENELLLAGSEDAYTPQVIKRFNVKSGITQPIASLSRNATSMDFRAIESVSPDREWMIGQGFGDEGPVYYCLSLKGSVYLTFPREGIVEGAWSPDSTRWSNASSVGTPLRVTEFPTPGHGKPIHYELGQGLSMPHLLGFAPDGAAVVGDIDFHTTPLDRVMLYQYKQGTSQKLSVHTVEFPATGIVEDVKIEPKGDRILWQFQVDLHGSQPAWLRKSHEFSAPTASAQSGYALLDMPARRPEWSDSRLHRQRECRWAEMVPSKTKFSFRTEHGSENFLWIVPLS